MSITSSDDLIYINDDDFLIAYDGAGDVQWRAPAAGGSLGTRPVVGLVAEHGRLFTLGDRVWYIMDGGGGRQLREDVNPSDTRWSMTKSSSQELHNSKPYLVAGADHQD